MTLPVGLDVTGRRALVVGGGPAVVEGARALVDAGALVHVVAPWCCEELEELAVAGGLSWSARDYAGPTTSTAPGSSSSGRATCTDDGVRADALAARVWCLDAALPDAGTAGLPPTARVTTPDGTVTVATHAPGDAALAVDVTRAVDGLLAGGALDLRRHRARAGPAGSPSSAAGRGPTGC